MRRTIGTNGVSFFDMALAFYLAFPPLIDDLNTGKTIGTAQKSKICVTAGSLPCRSFSALAVVV